MNRFWFDSGSIPDPTLPDLPFQILGYQTIPRMILSYFRPYPSKAYTNYQTAVVRLRGGIKHPIASAHHSTVTSITRRHGSEVVCVAVTCTHAEV